MQNYATFGFTFLQFFLELIDLLLKLAQHGVFRVFIDSGLIPDVLCTVSIAQGADGLVVIVICWSNVCALKEITTIKTD